MTYKTTDSITQCMVEEVTHRLDDINATEVRGNIAAQIQVFSFRVTKSNADYANLQIASLSQQPAVTNFLAALLDLVTA